MRTITFNINDKKILVQKDERYISENDIKSAIEDIVRDDKLKLILDKKIDLSEFCSLMFSIVYKGIITTIETINDIQVPINNIIFQVC